MGFKDIYQKITDGITYVLRKTPIEIGIGILAGALLLGVWSNNQELKKDRQIPLAFSEISQIKAIAEDERRELDSSILYRAELNDLVMKVLEPWNDSWSDSLTITENQAYEKYACNLNIKLTEKKYHHNLSDFLRDVPKQADAVLLELKDFTDAGEKVKTIDNFLDKSWDDRHVDTYHTEIYWDEDCYTDSEGNTHCTPVMKTKQVYDYTTHSYDYNKESGNSASVELTDLIKDYGDLSLIIPIDLAPKVKKENLEAIKKSRNINEKKKELTEKKYLELANTWMFGSDIYLQRNVLENPWINLKNDAVEWEKAKDTARSDSYRTYCHYDSGPIEFQVAEKALNDGIEYVKSVEKIIKGVKFSRINIPKLEEKIRKFVTYGVHKDMPKGIKMNKMAKEIRDDAIAVYKENFGKGLPLDTYGLGWVVLWTFLGALGGGAVGFGVDQAGQFIWGRKEDDD